MNETSIPGWHPVWDVINRNPISITRYYLWLTTNEW